MKQTHCYEHCELSQARNVHNNVFVYCLIRSSKAVQCCPGKNIDLIVYSITCMLNIIYHTRENFNLVGKKMVNLVNREPCFCQNFPCHYSKIHGKCIAMAYAPTVTYSTNFSLPIAFTCMVCQNFPRQIFPMYGKC